MKSNVQRADAVYTIATNSSQKKPIKAPLPRHQILLELPGQMLGRHLKVFILRPFDINNRLTRGANDPDTPRSKRDTVCSEVKTRWGKVGAEEVLETGTRLHEVEEITEGLQLAEVELGLFCPDIIVYLEHDEQI